MLMKCWCVYEMLCLWNVVSMKCHVYEMSLWWNVLLMKCCVYEMSCQLIVCYLCFSLSKSFPLIALNANLWTFSFLFCIHYIIMYSVHYACTQAHRTPSNFQYFLSLQKCTMHLSKIIFAIKNTFLQKWIFLIKLK